MEGYNTELDINSSIIYEYFWFVEVKLNPANNIFLFFKYLHRVYSVVCLYAHMYVCRAPGSCVKIGIDLILLPRV